MPTTKYSMHEYVCMYKLYNCVIIVLRHWKLVDQFLHGTRLAALVVIRSRTDFTRSTALSTRASTNPQICTVCSVNSHSCPWLVRVFLPQWYGKKTWNSIKSYPTWRWSESTYCTSHLVVELLHHFIAINTLLTQCISVRTSIPHLT